jgi:hypothetical protein
MQCGKALHIQAVALLVADCNETSPRRSLSQIRLVVEKRDESAP